MYQQIDSNKRRTIVLMIIATLLVFAVVIAIKYIYGYGPELLIVAIFLSLFMNLIAYYQGDKISLSLNGAKKINKEDNAYVYRLVENLSITAGLPLPKIYIINDQAMNAFATGRDPEHASIALTQGIIEQLEDEELEGVIAHELSHIKNYDIRLMMIIVALVGVITILIDFAWRSSFNRHSDRKNSNPILILIGVAFIILAPLLGQLIQLAISRKREYLADASGALLTRYPAGLASALEKISQQSRPLAKANHATAHLFLASPFGSTIHKGINRFFATHPPIEDRIAQLRSMA